MKECGICDNCLKKAKSELNPEELNIITGKILSQLALGPSTLAALMIQLNNISKDKAWKVIQFLQAENKIDTDQDGNIRVSSG